MIDKKLREYIETNIMIKYDILDKAHNQNHINQVINASFEIIESLDGINENIVYTVAAFHDLGNLIDRGNHHIISAQFAREDKFLNDFFNSTEINMIAQAIEDHRASGTTPRSIYGKIVSDADKDYDFDKIIIRCIDYRLDLDFDDSFSEVRKHVYDKYRTGGYLKEFYIKKKDKIVQDKFDKFCGDDEYAISEFKRVYYEHVFNKSKIIENICYTDLVYGRINKKLKRNMTNSEIEELVCQILMDNKTIYTKTGKNYYLSNLGENIRLTINSYTYRVITADIIG